MNKNENVGCWYSWPMIIIMLCVFFPVGVYLLVKRVSIDKKAVLFMGKLVGALGITFYCIAALGVFVCISEGFAADDVSLTVFSIVAGIVLSIVAKKVKTEAESAKQYLFIIVNGNVRQLDAIASTTGKAYDTVRKEIEELIKKGYLKNAYIDENLRAVILADGASAFPNAASAVAEQTKIVHCPYCGANSTIYGNIGECEYCGSPLSGS